MVDIKVNNIAQSAALWGNGDIDGFINAYLTAAANGEIKK